MTFSESVRICMGPKYLFSIKGRAPRSEFWWFTLFGFLVSVGLQILAGFLPEMIFGVISFCVGLALFPPSFGVTVRRLHDLNLSGWWILFPYGALLFCEILLIYNPVAAILFILIASMLIPVAFLIVLCLPGTPGPNRFGEMSGFYPELSQ